MFSSLKLCLELLDLELELGQLTLRKLRLLHFTLKLKPHVFEFFLGLRTHLFENEVALSDFLVDLGFLFFIRLDQCQKCSFLVSLDISHQKLILSLEVTDLVSEA